jgi:hypothetical protein
MLETRIDSHRRWHYTYEWQQSINTVTCTPAFMGLTSMSRMSSSIIWPTVLKSTGMRVSSKPSSCKKKRKVKAREKESAPRSISCRRCIHFLFCIPHPCTMVATYLITRCINDFTAVARVVHKYHIARLGVLGNARKRVFNVAFGGLMVLAVVHEN